MNFLYLIVSIGFFLWVIQNILFWVELWQQNEYSYARLYTHLKETVAGRSLIYSPLGILKIFLILIYGYIVLNPDFLAGYQTLIGLIYVYQGALVIKRYYQRLYFRPIFTLKATISCLLPFFVISLLYFVPLTIERYFWLLLLDRFVVFLILFIIFILSFPTTLYQDWYIDGALKIMKKYNSIIVIGIAGSYGKTSTKEFLSQILKSKFNVVKTQMLHNNAFGIAKTVSDRISPKTQVFIAEMGMYKKNEIAEIANIIKPKIGIITGISAQHASLTGGIQATIDAKYELIKRLSKDGLALFNGNNEYAYKLYKKTNKKKVLYGRENRLSAGIKALNVRMLKKSLTFDVLINDRKLSFKTSLIGYQNIENILPGIFIADKLGMKPEAIKKAVSSLSPIPHTMNIVTTISGATIIDDTVNTDPEAIFSALDYMKLYKNRRILVLQPMIELGKDAEKIHYEVAKKISKICDFLFLTNSNFYKSIFGGIIDGDGECYVKVGSAKLIAKFLLENCANDDIVILEGKEAKNVLEEIL